MNNHLLEEISQGFQAAFINSSLAYNDAYRSEFVSNNYKEGRKVLSSLEDEFIRCDCFFISVAFITMSGITPLLQILKELEKKGIPGKILTTNYLCFSEPKALKTLANLSNIELKMYNSNEANEGFHTKGYVFKTGDIYKIIIGSSNITLNALTRNKEWNTKFVSTKDGIYIKQIMSEFHEFWSSDFTKSYDDFISEYTQLYLDKKRNETKISSTKATLLQKELHPNKMQLEFIANFHDLQEHNEKKALLISATGTGKTYAAAFALKSYIPKKALFLVHREQIAKQALKSFKRVFGNSKTMGLLSGNSKDCQAEYLFSTIQTMSKENYLKNFSRKEFDIIMIDEVHRAGAASYQTIMEYFQPDFWLGMSASPDRTDGFDIYELFDHNIAYEIRLQQALEEDLLCPFHYFGITDLEINGESFDDDSLRNFSRLVCNERVEHVIKQAEFYGYDGNRVKGLVFCSSKYEGLELSKKFNEKGYLTTFLSGDDSQTKREDCIDRLVDDKRADYLDYIFTVDIFNEGVDIPEINQIIMLRPTESPIVFIQQLGRGLRKAEGKEYVVILDFIGNYTNNFMIPIALSGDRSYNKDNIRRYISEGTRIIPGSSSIHFDEISRKRIYASIDQAKTYDMQFLKQAYQNLKYKLGYIPKIKDFYEYGSIDITKIFIKCGSYHNFLKKYEKDYYSDLVKEEEIILEFLSNKVANGKRIHELLLLDCIIHEQQNIIEAFSNVLKIGFAIDLTEKDMVSSINYLTNLFSKDSEQKKYKPCVFITKTDDDNFIINENFGRLLKHKPFYDKVVELIDFGIEQYERQFSQRYKNTNFQLYQKYTYEDICRLLNWKRNMNALNIGGYFYDGESKTLPVFINYDKSDEAIPYQDRFINEYELIALSKHPRQVTSSDVLHIYKRTIEDKQNRIYLFVRKNKDDKEAKEFYFLGELNAIGEPKAIKMQGTNDDAFEITYRLDDPVREDIYNYIINS